MSERIEVSAPSRPAVRMVDFNRVLMWLNGIVLVATIIAFAEVGGNDFLNGEAIVLAGFLALQTHVALLIERRRRDPFVVLLAFIIIVYYSLRFFTLLLFPFSWTIGRYEYEPDDSTAALRFILLANVFLYVGLYLGRTQSGLQVEVGRWRAKSPVKAIVLVVATILLVYGRGVLWDPASVPRVLQFFLILVSQSTVLVIALAYYMLFRKTLSRRFASILLGLLVIEMLLHLLSGSRSAIVYTLQNVLLVILAIHGALAVRRRVVVLGLALLPVVIAVLLLSFTVSTFIRASNATGEPFSVSKAIDLSRLAGGQFNREYALEAEIPVMLARAGFFDFSADAIASRDQYAEVVNIPAYLRSITDNLLTPGFDLFDQPRIANALRFQYEGLGKPSKAASAEAYQSDQLGIYGELYILFGYAALPLFLIGAFLIKRTYVAVDAANPMSLTLKRVVILSTFVSIINSFGLDWVMLALVTLVISVYIYRPFFAAAPVMASGKESALIDGFDPLRSTWP